MKPTRTISHWQLHNLSIKPEALAEYGQHTEEDTVMIISGNVVDDPTGKWRPGFHMRSTIIIKLDREAGVAETQNTFYKLVDPEGDTTLGGDWGDGILSVFY